jgi:hypothetical protein
MSEGEADGNWSPEDDAPPGWPVPLRGVTESVIATKGPNGLWNLAALGLHAGDPVTARTYGNTRTRRNLERRGGGVVQFVADPRTFVDAALSIREGSESVLPSAGAWVEVDATRLGSREEAGTTIREWELTPGESEVVREGATTINRGFGAVIEATVAASRLGVSGFDDDELRARLDHLADVVERCGGGREREAIDRIATHADWEGAGPEN